MTSFSVPLRTDLEQMVSDYGMIDLGSTSRIYISLALGSLRLKARSHYSHIRLVLVYSTMVVCVCVCVCVCVHACKICRALEIQEQLVSQGI